MSRNKPMKYKFIRFLKKNHAFEEFKEEISPDTMDDLNVQFTDGGAEFVLCDGALFFWNLADTGIDWGKLNEEWLKVMREEEAVCLQ